jgi:hypothetical protein
LMIAVMSFIGCPSMSCQPPAKCPGVFTLHQEPCRIADFA